jgi:hypothetical protein
MPLTRYNPMQRKEKTSGQPVAVKPLRPLILIAALMLLIPMIFLALLHLPIVQNLIIKQIITHVERNVAVEVHLESFHWWPIGRLRLTQISVQHQGHNLLHCDQVNLSYRFSMRRPFFSMSRITLTRPRVQLHKDLDGNWILPGIRTANPQSPERGTWPWGTLIPLEVIRVEAGSILVQQQGRTVPLLSLQNVNGTLAALLEAVNSVPGFRMNLKHLEGQLEQPRVGKLRLVGEVVWRDGHFLLNALQVDVAERTQLLVEGDFAFSPQLDANININIAPLCWACIPALHDRLPGVESLWGHLHLAVHAGKFVVEHKLTAEAVTLDGTLTLNADPQSAGSVHWVTAFEDLKVPYRQGSLGGRLNGQLEATVEGFQPESMHGQVECHLERSSIGRETIDKGSLRANYENGNFTLNFIDLRTPFGSLIASGAVDLTGLWDKDHRGKAEAKLEIKGRDLERLLALPIQHQPLDLQMNLQGHYGSGQLKDLPKWNATAALQLNAPGVVGAKATATYESRTLNLQYNMDARNLQVLAEFAPQWAMQGQLESQGTFHGKWPEFLWDGKILLKKFQYAGVLCENCAITGRGELQGRRANRQLTLNASGLSIGDVLTRTARLELEQTESSCQFKLSGEKIANHGSLQLTGMVHDLWTLPGRLALQNGRLGWRDQNWALDGQLAFDPTTISVETLRLRQDAQELRLSGRLSSEKENQLQLTWDRMRIEKLLAHLGIDVPVSGDIAGNAQLTGSLEQPQGSLDCKITRGRLYGEQNFESQVRGSFAARQLNLAGTLRSSSVETPVSFSGYIPLHFSLKPVSMSLLRDQPLAASLQLTGLDAASLLPYIPVIDKVAGRLGTSAKLSGTFNQPELNASGSWTQGTLQLKPWPFDAQQLQLEWQADSHQISIRTAKLEILGGHASVAGEIKPSLGMPREINLQADAQDITIPEIYGISGKGSGHFGLLQTSQATKIIGTFDFTQAAMNLGEFETDLARNIQVIGDDSDKLILEVNSSKQSNPQAPDRVEMDLELKTPPAGTWVRGKGLDAEVKGTVRLRKDSAGPLKVFGNLRSIRGTYTFQGHRLTIVEGELAFLGVTEPIPTLSVLGQKEVQGVTIQVRVTGPLSQPKLLLSSLPAMNQVDILSYLLFGRAATQLTSKENAGLQQNAAIFFGSDASREFKKLLGDSPFAPDVLQLSNSEKGGGVVEIGKYLTPDFYVTYEKGLTSDQGDQIQLEYRFNRHISIQSQIGLNQQRTLQSQTTERDQSGIDVLWRYDFGD